jgi:chromosome segregation ATPase
MKTAFKNIDRAANKIMKKRSTKERIGWYYVNVPNKIYPMSQLHKGRTSRVRYVYKEDKRSQEAKAKAQQKYDQIKKEYEALGKQFKEAKNQYDAALAEYKKQCECKCEECTGKMNAIKEEGKNLEKSIEESKKELSSLTEV